MRLDKIRDWKFDAFGYKLSYSQLKFLSCASLLSSHPMVSFNLFLSAFPFWLFSAFPSFTGSFCLPFFSKECPFCCYSYLASRKTCLQHWKLLWHWGHWIWPVKVSRRNTWYVDILRWSCHDGCSEHSLIWQCLHSLQFWLKRKPVCLGSKDATCSLVRCSWKTP